ncbi:MAG: ATP-binding cassette domain-containing protein [Bacillota bacterium]
MSVIEVRNITKNYGSTCALNNISARIEPNMIYGLLGRNGAGKTTLLNLITNSLFPTSGVITVDGENVLENDNAIGKMFYMTEKNFYPEGMRIKEIFRWAKEFYPSFDMGYAFALCKSFGLNPNKKVKALSTGYNSIAKLIAALASNAQILIFDEPVLGLDAHHRDMFYKELLNSYIKNPKTIILSTHIIDEIADMLERVIIIKDKKVLIDESVEKILEAAYCVSGAAENVDKYIEGRKCINIEQLGSFKAATIIGETTDKDKSSAEELTLEFSKVKLQKLFIHLTGEGDRV